MSDKEEQDNQENKQEIQDYEWSDKDFLGKGAYGKVYKGINKITNEVVAVKEMDQKLLQTQKGRDGFQQEVDVMVNFESDNIVKMHLYDISTTRAIIIMEMCPDGDLRQYLNKKNKKLTEDECIAIIRQLMKGFKEITDKGFIHRDIKPENALKKGDCFKVADFGFAKQINIQDSNTKIKEFIGTPLYMSPQILKQLSYSAKSDIWSIGMVFYELLFGYLPYPSRDYYSYMTNVWKKSLKFPVDKPIGVHTKDFVEQCLKKLEEDRIGWDTIFDHPLLNENSEDQKGEMVKPKYEFGEQAKKVIIRIQKLASEQCQNIDKQLEEWFQDDKQYNKEEFFLLLQKIDSTITQQDVDQIFLPIDLSGNQQIDLKEFKQMVINYDFTDINDQVGRLIYELTEVIKARRIDLYDIFQNYDTDKGGSVDKSEFSKLVKDFFPNLGEKEIQQLFEFFDKNNDSHISFKEFFDTMNIQNKQKDIIDEMNDKIVNVFTKAGKFIKEYNISIKEVQFKLDDSYIDLFDFNGFSKFLKIFDDTLTETEMHYAFSNPSFQVDFYSDEKLVELSKITKVLSNPEELKQNIKDLGRQCQAKIEEIRYKQSQTGVKNIIDQQDLAQALQARK